MIGVVLAGGRSTRLGQDKVRLRLPGDGRDMLARTADLLAACTDGVVISCRAPDAGEETLALPGIRSIPDAKPGLGPLEPREKPRERGLPGAAAADDGRDGL